VGQGSLEVSGVGSGGWARALNLKLP
jgi:hypothetical protein